MNSTKRNLGLTIALIALMAVPAVAQQQLDGRDKESLKDSINRQLNDVSIGESLTLEEQAVVHYQQAVGLVQKAIAQTQKANENEGAKREKLLKKVAKSYKGAAREFALSTDKNPTLLESWSGLGWVYRQTAQWDEAIDAYDRALTVEPTFTAAVEGRAEACLALNRTDEVRQAYAQLERADQKNAKQLLSAVETWVRKQHTAGQADNEGVREMMALVVEKRQAS